MDRNLDEARAGGVCLLDELHADGAGFGAQGEPVEQLASNQTKIAVDVPHRQPEQHANESRVQATDDDPVHRIAASDLVALRDVDVVREGLPERVELARIVLAVPVGVEDRFAIRGAKTRVEQCGAWQEFFPKKWPISWSTKGFPEKGAASKGGPARYQTPIEAACADRRIERYSFSRDHPVL